MKLKLILKIAIAVLTAIAGVLGVQTLSSCTAGITMGKSNAIEQRVINSADSTTLSFGLYPYNKNN